MILIRHADVDDVPALYHLYDLLGKKDDEYFEHALTIADVFMAFDGDVLCGFCLFNSSPRYALYKKLNIPEIQDLNVLPDYRRKGIATRLIEYCEAAAREQRCDHIGISVGLTKDYGPAQILYTKAGFVADGNGVTYDREGVDFGKSYPMDDELALMLIKSL